MRLISRRALELDLRKAIANAEFEVYYQPIHYLQTGKVSGFEALVRWNLPERGMISPADFIPLAEETGLILPLGEWVLRTACLHAAKWPQPVGVAVNLSAMQFKGCNLVQLTLNALAASGLPRGVSTSKSPSRRCSRTKPTRSRCCISSARSACGFRWTISAPAIRRWHTWAT